MSEIGQKPLPLHNRAVFWGPWGGGVDHAPRLEARERSPANDRRRASDPGSRIADHAPRLELHPARSTARGSPARGSPARGSPARGSRRADHAPRYRAQGIRRHGPRTGARLEGWGWRDRRAGSLEGELEGELGQRPSAPDTETPGRARRLGLGVPGRIPWASSRVMPGQKKRAP